MTSGLRICAQRRYAIYILSYKYGLQDMLLGYTLIWCAPLIFVSALGGALVMRGLSDRSALPLVVPMVCLGSLFSECLSFLDKFGQGCYSLPYAKEHC